jgi:hypothetical protein
MGTPNIVKMPETPTQCETGSTASSQTDAGSHLTRVGDAVAPTGGSRFRQNVLVRRREPGRQVARRGEL